MNDSSLQNSSSDHDDSGLDSPLPIKNDALTQ